MGLPVYLAQTYWEMMDFSQIPENTAYMACHFSSYGSGLEKLPEGLPKIPLLILNDRIPVWNHDPVLVTAQLKEAVETLEAGAILLDFQRKNCPGTESVANAVISALPCPVGISESYAQERDCPVFLSPLPLRKTLEEYVAPWKDREIWLDIAMNAEEITVTKDGSQFTDLTRFSPDGSCHKDPELLCSYQIRVLEDRAVFTLFRTREDIAALLQQAEGLGVTRAVGLYQELGQYFPL